MKSGWQTKTLGEILQKTETINPIQSPDIEFDYIDVSSVSNQTFRIEAVQRLEGKDAPSRARRLVKAGDILFATVRPTLRRIAVVPDELDSQVCSTGYFVLRPKEGIDNKFLFYFLFTEDFMIQMERLQKGASYPAVTDGEVRAQVFQHPPLPEQRRIVGILDEAFDGIATAKANAEKNLQNARALFESHLQSVFTQRGEGWPIRKLGELSDHITDGTHNSPPYVETGIPMLDSKHVKDGFVIDDTEPEKFISPATDVLLAKRCKPRTGDILISSRGSIGKIAIVREGQDFNIMGNMILIRLPAGVNREFAAFYLHSQVAHIDSIARGVAQKGLYLNQIREYELPLPSEAKQGQIGKQLDALSAETQRLESIYQRKLAALASLKKSLLHQAFSGQL